MRARALLLRQPQRTGRVKTRPVCGGQCRIHKMLVATTRRFTSVNREDCFMNLRLQYPRLARRAKRRCSEVSVSISYAPRSSGRKPGVTASRRKRRTPTRSPAAARFYRSRYSAAHDRTRSVGDEQPHPIRRAAANLGYVYRYVQRAGRSRARGDDAERHPDVARSQRAQSRPPRRVRSRCPERSAPARETRGYGRPDARGNRPHAAQGGAAVDAGSARCADRSGATSSRTRSCRSCPSRPF